MKFTMQHGSPFRVDDGRVLRTKVVATLGTPGRTYENGIYLLDNRHVGPHDLTIGQLTREFFFAGADVVRLNLAHVSIDDVREVYLAVKNSILECERQAGCRKRMAVLADLPGPKIRTDDHDRPAPQVGDTIRVHFGECPPNAAARPRDIWVQVDGRPLVEVLLESDSSRPRFDLNTRFEPRLVENVLGGVVLPPMAESTADRLRRTISSRPGTLVYLGDGDAVLTVRRVIPGDSGSFSIECDVGSVQTRTLKKRRAFTIKEIDLDIPSFTEEDHRKITRLLEVEYEDSGRDDWQPTLAFVGLSFAQTADDILRARYAIERWLGALPARFAGAADAARLMCPALIAKIETRKGCENVPLILDVADGIMVARGDLGLQLDIAQVPEKQKELIYLSNRRGKPVITATEMLKTMQGSMEPTRAEATDVFNAILDGSDAVMMSEETADGLYPLHAIQKMVALAVAAELRFEGSDLRRELQRARNLRRYEELLHDDYEEVGEDTVRLKSIRDTLETWIDQRTVMGGGDTRWREELNWRRDLFSEKVRKSLDQMTTNRITQAACVLSESEYVRVVAAATTSGRTARMISRLRPGRDIVGATHDPINMRKLILSHGVIPLCIDEVAEDGPIGDSEANSPGRGIFAQIEARMRADGYLRRLLGGPEAFVIFTSGTPLKKPGTTNILHIRRARGALSATGDEARERARETLADVTVA